MAIQMMVRTSRSAVASPSIRRPKTTRNAKNVRMPDRRMDTKPSRLILRLSAVIVKLTTRCPAVEEFDRAPALIQVRTAAGGTSRSSRARVGRLRSRITLGDEQLEKCVDDRCTWRASHKSRVHVDQSLLNRSRLAECHQSSSRRRHRVRLTSDCHTARNLRPLKRPSVRTTVAEELWRNPAGFIGAV